MARGGRELTNDLGQLEGVHEALLWCLLRGDGSLLLLVEGVPLLQAFSIEWQEHCPDFAAASRPRRSSGSDQGVSSFRAAGPSHSNGDLPQLRSPTWMPDAYAIHHEPVHLAAGRRSPYGAGGEPLIESRGENARVPRPRGSVTLLSP